MQKQLSDCQEELRAFAAREKSLMERLDRLENKQGKADIKFRTCGATDEVNSNNEFYLVGSSLLRDVRTGDILNGRVKSIPGGTIKDVSNEFKALSHVPKTVVIQIGGNDICKEYATIDGVSTAYVAFITEVKDKLPNARVVIAGLPPRFPDETVRTKVKNLNERLKKWANENQLLFINNEDLFELKSGTVDSSAFVMTGTSPGIHLNRKGTIRWLRNLNEYMPDIVLSNHLEDEHPLYAEVTKYNQNQTRVRTTQGSNTRLSTKQKPRQVVGRSRGCYLCGEMNHIASSCKHGRKIECFYCWRPGHKWQQCMDRPHDWRPKTDSYKDYNTRRNIPQRYDADY